MYLLLDIGASKIRIGISEDLKDIDSHQIVKTPKNFEEGIDLIKQTAANLAKGEVFKAVAVGIREILDPKKERLINDPKSSLFPDWVQKPIKQILEHEFNTTVFLENDATMAALGEAIWGSGQGFDNVAYLTISSGLGGSRILNGKPDPVASFEPGEQIINFLGELIYLDDLASGHDLEKKYQQKPENIIDQKVWDKLNKALAVGIYNLIALWSPGIIVLGGGMSKRLSLEEISGYLKGFNRKFPKLPEVVFAKLDDLSGIYGCLEYLKQNTNQT